MTDARSGIANATRALVDVSDTPRLDAELLMAHAMQISREDLVLRHLDSAVPDAFAALLSRRMAHEPIAYITGTRAFWTIDLAVGPGALIPRPDSETMIEAAVAHFVGRVPGRILDLGTGPGTLLLAALAEWAKACGTGIDMSEQALDYARRNAIALGMDMRAEFVTGDWATGVEGKFDLILANPPYIAERERLPPTVADHEPHVALFAGADGLDAYRAIIPDLPRLIASAGLVVLEIGHSQADAVSAMLREVGLTPHLHVDLAGRPRVVSAD